jgi:hypothetical protein
MLSSTRNRRFGLVGTLTVSALSLFDLAFPQNSAKAQSGLGLDLACVGLTGYPYYGYPYYGYPAYGYPTPPGNTQPGPRAGARAARRYAEWISLSSLMKSPFGRPS